MGIRFNCPNGHKLNVKDFQAGLPGICPFCAAKMQIPLESTRQSSKSPEARPQGGAAANAPPPKAMASPPPMTPKAVSADPLSEAGEVAWYVRPASGGQYGPATADVMRSWLAEGRLNADSLVWREGWRDWQEAGVVFPQLSPSSPIPDLDTILLDTAPAPIQLHPVKRNTRSQSKQMVIIGGLCLTVVVLLVVLIAILCRS